MLNRCVRSLLAPLALLLAPLASAQDRCATAIPIDLGAPQSFDTTGLSATPLAWWIGCGSTVRPDIWFSFSAPTEGEFVATTCGSSNLALELFRGGCGALELVDCDNGRCRHESSFQRGGKVFFHADAGETIHIRIGTWVGSAGTVSGVLRVEDHVAAPNDDCATPEVLVEGQGTFADLFEATLDGPPPPCGDSIASDLWYEFTPQSDGTFELSTCALGASTLPTSAIAVYDGTCTQLTLLGCSAGNCSNGRGAVHSFVGLAGQRYLVRILGWHYRTYGDITLHRVGGAPQDECATAPSFPVDTFDSWDLSGTTLSQPAWACGGGGVAGDLWREVTLTATGTHEAYAYAFYPYPADLSIEVWRGPCGSGTLLACAESTSSPSPTPIVNFHGFAGETVRVRVGSSVTASVDGGMTVRAGPGNDECADATVVPLETRVSFQTGAANASTFGWSCATPSLDDDVWLTFTAATDGPLRVRICEEHDSLRFVEVYDGTCGALSFVACAPAGADCDERSVWVPAIAGTQYFVRVNDPNYDATGEILVTAWPSHSNLDCGNAVALTLNDALPFDFVGVDPVTQPGWSDGCSSTFGRAALYYTFTPQTSGRYSFRAESSGPLSHLSLYDGTCAQPAHLQCSSPMNAFDGTEGGATLEADLTAGNPVILRVLDRPGDDVHGSIVVTTGAAPPNDDCVGAIPFGPGTLVFDLSYAGTTSEPLAGCATASALDRRNEAWYVHDAVADGHLALQTCSPSVRMISVYQGVDCSSLQALDCALPSVSATCALGEGTSAVFPVTAGERTYVRLHARDGGIGYLDVSDAPYGDFGAPYCAVTPNSTGAPAALTAYGSPRLALDELWLRGSSLPANTFCLFAVGAGADFVMNPGGSAGNLCLAGPVGRYNRPGETQVSSASGEAELRIDVTDPPPVGLYQPPFASGETWRFQLWFRDLAGSTPTSNFSNGVAVTFE